MPACPRKDIVLEGEVGVYQSFLMILLSSAPPVCPSLAAAA